MKHLSLALLLLSAFFSSANLNAQRKSSNQIKELNGSAFKPKKSDRTYTFTNALKIGDYYYVVGKRPESSALILLNWARSSADRRDFRIFKVDKKMNVKEVFQLPAEFNDKYVQSYTIQQLGDKLCAYFYFNNTKLMKQFLFAQLVDPKTMKASGKPWKIAETAITKKERKIGCIFRVSVSEDKSKMLITADRTNVPLSRREKKAAAAQKNHTFNYWLIDSEFKLINVGKNVKIGKGNTNVIGQVFDNEGNMAILGFESAVTTSKKSSKKIKNTDDDDEGSDDNDSKLIMKIIKPDGETNELTFANGEYFYSAMMRLNPNTGNIAVVGLIASGNYGAKGIFTQQVNLKTAEVLTENRQLFGTAMVKEMSQLKPPSSKSSSSKSSSKKQKESSPKKSKKTSKKSDPDYIYNFVRLGSLHYNDSNELIVVGQKYYSYTVTYTTTDSKGNRTTHTVTYYVYGDIISFKLNADGVIENFGYIFHHVEYTYPVYKDYSSLFTGEKLFVLTKSGGCQMGLNNNASALSPFKEYNTFSKRNSFADFLNVSDNEMIHILSRKSSVTFSSMTVQPE